MKNLTVNNCWDCAPLGCCPFKVGSGCLIEDKITPGEINQCHGKPAPELCPFRKEPVVFSNPMRPFIGREPIT